MSAKSDILELAQKHGVKYVPTPYDALAETITRLSGDDIVSDEIENLLLALYRAKHISASEHLDMLHAYLKERFGSE